MCDRAWHYTTGQKFSLIVMTRQLLPATAGVRPPEKPVVWFSKNQIWEPTANKFSMDANGKAVILSKSETGEYGGGLVRFGLRKQKLLPWYALIKAARIPRNVVVELEQAGIKSGANPLDWCGSLKPISVDDCDEIEVMNDQGEWQAIATNRGGVND